MEEGTGISLYILVGSILFGLFALMVTTFGTGIQTQTSNIVECVQSYVLNEPGDCMGDESDSGELPSEGGSPNYTDIEEFMNIEGLDPYTAYLIAISDFNVGIAGEPMGLQVIVGTGEEVQTYTNGDMDSVAIKTYIVTDVNKLPTGPEYQHAEVLNDSGEVIAKSAYILPEGANRPTVEYSYTTEEYSRSVAEDFQKMIPIYENIGITLPDYIKNWSFS